MVEVASPAQAYTAFVEEVGQRLRLALFAAFGPDTGAEATAEALAYGWEHWDRLRKMENPAGYLYKVGRSRAGRAFRPRPYVAPPPPSGDPPWVEPALPKALEDLPERQRASVLLVHGYGWTLQEAADVLGVGRSTVQRHVDRAVTKLREVLEVEDAG